MDILGQSSLLVGITSFALGFSVLSRNVRNILFIAFASLNTLVSAWALSFFLNKVWPDFGFYRLHLLFNILLAPACLYFIRVLVRIQDLTSRRLLDLSLFSSAVLAAALLFGWESKPWVLQLIYFLPALVFLQTMQLMWIDQKLKSKAKRTPKLPTVGLTRRNLIYFGALVVLAMSVMDHIPWLGNVIPSLGNLALAAYLFFLSQAITQQRLLNMSALFSRFLVLLAVAFTLTIMYSLLLSWIASNSPGLFFLNSFIASFLIITLLDPLRALVAHFTQRLLTQKNRRLQSTLREAQRKLTGVLDSWSLFQLILATAESILEPRWAALFVLRSDATKYRRVRMVGREPEEPEGTPPILREILADHPLLQYLGELANKGKFPVLLDQIIESEIDRSASRSQREHFAMLIQGLKALGGNLMIPLFHAGSGSGQTGKILGFIILSAPTPPEPWGHNWGLLPIIYPYFEQAAHTMQSMEIYARQREKERLAVLGEMAAGLAHEIRNPLGAIKGAAQYLDPSANRPESKFLQVIVDEVDRLNRVVTQFLDYSKPFTADLKQVDLSVLVEKTLDLMRPSLSSDIELEFKAPPSPVFVMASAEQIQQVLINLIQNAQRALSKAGGQRVTEDNRIRVNISPPSRLAQNEVTLMVEDTGHGIKKEHLDKLFIPFFTTSPQGTGLGLSISQKIVEAHRGRIEVLSEEGRFTRIFVILPVVPGRA